MMSPGPQAPTRTLIRLLLLAVACAVAAFLVACRSPLEPGQTLTLEVAEVLVPCHGPFPMECMVAREPGGEWLLFYGDIKGFTFVWGTRSVLRVRRSVVPEPAADASVYSYRLLRTELAVPGPRREQVMQARAMQLRWLERRPSNYTMVQERLCFCGVEARGPARLQVHADGLEERIDDARYVASNAPVPVLLRDLFPSVLQLFSILHLALVSAHAVTVEYDEVRGFPRELYVDRNAHLADDEVHWRVQSLQ